MAPLTPARTAALLLMLTAALAAAELGQSPAVKNCYTCEMTGDDDTCLVAPEKVTSGAAYLPCKRDYCTIVRREYTANPGKAIGLTRGCENELPHKDGKQINDDYTFYWWTCSSNLCNTGDGTHAPAGGGGGGGGNDVGYVLVEGYDGAASLGGSLTLAALLLLLLRQLQ